MNDELGYVDLRDFCRAHLLKQAIEQAEADCASCVVRHASVPFESAADRVRARRAAETERPVKVLRMR